MIKRLLCGGASNADSIEWVEYQRVPTRYRKLIDMRYNISGNQLLKSPVTLEAIK